MRKDEEVGQEIESLITDTTTAANGSTSRRRRPVEHVRMRREGAPSNSLMLRLTCLSVLTLVVVSSMGLLTYIQDERAPKFQLIPFEASEDIGWEATPAGLSTGSLGNVDQNALHKLLRDMDMEDSKRQPHTVRYAPQFNQQNPFDFQGADVGPNPIAPLLPTSRDDPLSLGFLKMPHLVKNQLVFCSQGNVFLTQIQASGPMPAIKLTTTVGNVLDPRLHPNLRYLAYTATYTKRRDIYLLDLQGGSPAVRLTYWDTSAGVDGLVGWWGESSLVFRALSNQVSLPDYRLYVLHLEDMGTLNSTNYRIEPLEDLNSITQDDPARRAMFQIDSIPLSQARDAARFENCWYFVRYAQTSQTIRYVGGTAEQLYRYCDGATSANRLFFQDRYNGTSKAPQMYPNSKYLFFLSDRALLPDGSWTPDRMNVWAMPISENLQDHTHNHFIQITDTACDFEGRVIREYSVDSETGNMVVRLGADLYMMTANEIQTKLQKRRLVDLDENVTQVEDWDLPDTTDTFLGNVSTTKVYYKFQTPALESRAAQDQSDHSTGTSTELTRLPIVVHSDFHTHQERIIPVTILKHMTSADVYTTALGSLQFAMTLRGQLWVAPVENDSLDVYRGAGRNMPGRRYRVAPGATMGGIVRILTVRHVPNPVEDQSSDRRLAVILATDPLTPTAEHAFYLIETQSSSTPLFVDKDHLPKPFLGGSVSGGSTRDGGLGSVEPDSVSVSPCGRRMAWNDRDGRIVVMNLPQYQDMTNRSFAESVVLPQENENGQPMVGQGTLLSWSPGGRYLAVEHNARNQFRIISIVDLGDPRGVNKVADIQVGRIVQATPDRFNSESVYWGKSTADMFDFDRQETIASLLDIESPADVATTLYFLSDRDISTDVRSPWGTWQPMPHFKKLKSVFALPLYPTNGTSPGPFSGGGASELQVDDILALKKSLKAVLKSSGKKSRQLLQASLAGAFGLANDFFLVRNANDITRRLAQEVQEGAEESNATKLDEDTLRAAAFPEDMDIDFGPINDRSFMFARHAYRLATIPEANYVDIVSQTPDDGSFVLIKMEDEKASVVVYLADAFPSDKYTAKVFSPTSRRLATYGRSTSRDRLFFVFAPDGYIRVVSNTGTAIAKFLMDTELDNYVVSTSGLALSVWPSLEYRHLYDDAWRMLRDYFYDPDMTGIDWPAIHKRYLPLVSRCAKREELDDVLVQMASELSALHVFVYGGEYDTPLDGIGPIATAHDLASLGASFRRAPEWKGYVITSIAESDPDFSLLDGHTEIYSPLSDKTLRLSGQRGLKVGDVIVGINGESVMKVPDIHMLLRGMAGYSVKLDVLRLTSSEATNKDVEAEVPVEAVVVVPIKTIEADTLRYRAWEWKTRLVAEKLADDNGFSVGYVHLQDMTGPDAEDAFARGFFPNYNKQAMILDVRHNRGGNIDSWVLDVLQRKAWMYWQSRDYTVDNGGLGWDEQFAFRGHIVVLLDERTSSDGEGVSRGISELGLGRLIGTRTWGGGIWLASDNHLVDGGIASAPEIGTYNDNFGWGLGIEQMGVNPDIEVDNDPFQAFGGKDSQLEAAIMELKRCLNEEPIVVPKPPIRKRDMTMGERECSASM